MTYGKIISGIFRQRPNRFVAHVDTEFGPQICHVKNTGRCKELLVNGAQVYLEVNDNPARKTKYDLIAVEKGGLLINIDSQAPNQVAAEYIPTLFPQHSLLRAESGFGNSRFDFYLETQDQRWFIEVKGVTLEDQGVVMFPDAPTSRGTKHLLGLCDSVSMGYRACVLFVVQMAGARYFTPNIKNDPDFAEALREAASRGVKIMAVDCDVTPNSISARQNVPVKLVV